MVISDLNGLVLAGGKSSRMGKDKSRLVYHGKPQREFLFDLLSGFCLKVYTSCRHEQDIPDVLNPLPDLYNFQSPLNGILSAFDRQADVAWLVVAIDMPNVDEKAIDFLIRNRDASKVATCYYNEETHLPEPLLTIWEPHALSDLRKFSESGKISPRDFLSTHGAHCVKPPDRAILKNVNSPEDLL